MSVDQLQEKIRKLKNPSVVDMHMSADQIPPAIMEESGSYLAAYLAYCMQLLDALKEIVPAVRFGFGSLALLGAEGFSTLQKLLQQAKQHGYYVLLDGPEALSGVNAEQNAMHLFSQENTLYFDGLILSSYIGSDGIRPYAEQIKDSEKGLFVVVRTANRSAAELQDLRTGSRLVHAAAADIINRYADPLLGKSGYSKIAMMAGASSAESLQMLRSKYKYLFLLLDGYDYPNSNAKNCAAAFDRLGHGAAACAGESIVAAWKEEVGQDPVTAAVQAAQRMKKNLTRYITIL